uniref:Uncharacterized protein n=1 Tax=Globodera rostochiensis TaxID=31243 RepID=A0A914HY34_GLORO
MATVPMPPPQDQREQQKKSTWKPLLIATPKIPDPEEFPFGIVQTAIRASDRMRTTSEDSAESFDAYETDSHNIGDSGRRMSITERFFGRSMPRERSNSLGEEQMGEEKHKSITENRNFKDFMKRQRKILGDDEWQ